MNDEKRALRRVLRERRRSLPEVVVEAAGAAVFAQLRAFRPYRTARTVIAYIAGENEIPTAALVEDIVTSGRQLYLPQSAHGERFVHWRPGEALASGRGGVLEPLAGTPLQPDTPALALVPLVAWDRHGTRLGRGGGFYDRIFAGALRSILRVGLAYEFQQSPELPREPWDVPLDYVITERRIVQCVRGSVARTVSLQKGGLQL
jgi:5-formyltetrahydrofolate cyclo-ligase